MEIKLTRKKAKFLSSLMNALKNIPSTSTVESTTMNNVILRDLDKLENKALSKNKSFSGDLWNLYIVKWLIPSATVTGIEILTLRKIIKRLRTWRLRGKMK